MQLVPGAFITKSNIDKKYLIFIWMYDNISTFRGGVAHLGERLNGIQEVRGSIPLISTSFGISEALIYKAFEIFSFYA